LCGRCLTTTKTKFTKTLVYQTLALLLFVI
jgi:hypothetical protein